MAPGKVGEPLQRSSGKYHKRILDGRDAKACTYRKAFALFSVFLGVSWYNGHIQGMKRLDGHYTMGVAVSMGK